MGLARGALAPLAGAEARIAAIEDPVERLGVEGSLPPWLAERLVAEMGLDEARAFSAAVNVRAPLTVRANLLKTTRDDLRERLEEEGVESKETPPLPLGARARRPRQRLRPRRLQGRALRGAGRGEPAHRARLRRALRA